MENENSFQNRQLAEFVGRTVRITNNPSRCRQFAGMTGKVIACDLDREFNKCKNIYPNICVRLDLPDVDEVEFVNIGSASGLLLWSFMRGSRGWPLCLDGESKKPQFRCCEDGQSNAVRGIASSFRHQI